MSEQINVSIVRQTIAVSIRNGIDDKFSRVLHSWVGINS